MASRTLTGQGRALPLHSVPFKAAVDHATPYAGSDGSKGTSPAETHVWQRNYYERIIRNDDELNRVRQYIALNPAMWHHDRENPLREAGREIGDAWSWLEAPEHD